MANNHSFGSTSMAKLNTCHPDIQLVAIKALELSPYDFTIIHGWRGQEVQDALFDSGASTKQYPNSKHNTQDEFDEDEPGSEAIDFGPWINGKVPWDDTHIFAAIAGCFLAAAADLNVKLRWGGDWDSDGSTKDQTLMDWGHVELA